MATRAALALLDAPPDPGTARDVVSFLALCQHPDGGFGGGPGQMPHLAPTYAAVACLAEIATPDAFACVDRASMRAFLLRCRDDRVGAAAQAALAVSDEDEESESDNVDAALAALPAASPTLLDLNPDVLNVVFTHLRDPR